ncbi:MAG: class I SAM-dependent methyltransferase [Brevefilum sp.]|nr:class I SAM-dependent methyltransferase [Brevefilum sp.]
MSEKTPPVCDYEGSDYQNRFWEEGGRAYEDAVEAIALRRLLPPGGAFMLELGAGAGRNTPRYQNYQRIALVDYSRTQLEQARDRLGESSRYLYVAADVYRLPFVSGLFDGATMIRTLHHMADPVLALTQVRRVMAPQGAFILEFANKRNLKSMLRYLLGKQDWSPYALEPVEFAALNFDFHPKAIRGYLAEAGFTIEKQRTVSHFRVGVLKRIVPLRLLAGLDALLQWTGGWVQVSPSVFVRSCATGTSQAAEGEALFQCPVCQAVIPGEGHDLHCGGCGTTWGYQDGIYDFRRKD